MFRPAASDARGIRLGVGKKRPHKTQSSGLADPSGLSFGAMGPTLAGCAPSKPLCSDLLPARPQHGLQKPWLRNTAAKLFDDASKKKWRMGKPHARERGPCAQTDFNPPPQLNPLNHLAFGRSVVRADRRHASQCRCARRGPPSHLSDLIVGGAGLRRHLPSAVWVAARPQSPARTHTDLRPRAAKPR